MTSALDALRRAMEEIEPLPHGKNCGTWEWKGAPPCTCWKHHLSVALHKLGEDLKDWDKIIELTDIAWETEERVTLVAKLKTIQSIAKNMNLG